jgi:nucleoside-diphosphate-sugar epimerase
VDDRDRQREQVLDHAIVVRADGGDGIRRFAVRRGVANGGQITINGLAEKILALTGSASPVIHRDARAGDVRHSTAAIEKLRETGFTPAGNFDAELAATVNWFRCR